VFVGAVREPPKSRSRRPETEYFTTEAAENLLLRKRRKEEDLNPGSKPGLIRGPILPLWRRGKEGDLPFRAIPNVSGNSPVRVILHRWDYCDIP